MTDTPHSRFGDLVVEAGHIGPRQGSRADFTGRVTAMSFTQRLVGEHMRDESLSMVLEARVRLAAGAAARSKSSRARALVASADEMVRQEVRVPRTEAAFWFKETALGDTVQVSGHSGGGDFIQASLIEIVERDESAQLERLKAAATSQASAAVSASEAMVQAIERYAAAGGEPHDVQEAVAQAVGSGTGISDFLSSEAEMTVGHLVDDAAACR